MPFQKTKRPVINFSFAFPDHGTQRKIKKNATENFLTCMQYSSVFICVVAFVFNNPSFIVSVALSVCYVVGCIKYKRVNVWMCLLSEAIDKFNVACSHKYFLKG